MLQAKLQIVGGKHHGKVIPLAKEKFLIGREQDCHLRPSSEMVSRHHCVFTLDEHTLWLRDLGSTNGTLLNDERLRGEAELKIGDRVQIGPLVFEVHVAKVDSSTTAKSPGDTVSDSSEWAALSETTQLSAHETTYQLPTDAAVSETEMFQMPQQDAAASQNANGSHQAPDGTTPPPPPAGPPNDPHQQQQPGAYPQAPIGFPQQAMPFPQMPAQYLQPGMMPYPQQPGMYPQQPGMYPQQPVGYPGQQWAYPQQPAESAPENQDGSTISETPVRLPDPVTTGAKAPEPEPPAKEKTQEDSAQASEMNPAEKAADIIKQHLQRRPDLDD